MNHNQVLLVGQHSISDYRSCNQLAIIPSSVDRSRANTIRRREGGGGSAKVWHTADANPTFKNCLK